MPIIEFSQGITYNTSGVNVADNLFGVFPKWIAVYKGAVPTDFSGLTVISDRDTDKLWQAENSPYSTDSINQDLDGNPVIMNTDIVAATATGTATWFRLFTNEYYFSYGNSNSTYQLIGTVGNLGSGADMELSNLNFVAGNPFRVQNFKITIPTVFTYS